MKKSFFPIVLLIFTASGFAGLIYESVWSHYLKLFLGHAAYAQTLVLAIFMGGMALGAAWCSRISARWRDLLFAYAIIEALIGLAALAFHPAFNAVTEYAFAHIIPAIGNPAGVQAFKWTLGAALILPQSVLLGMTFPLLTAGVVRLRPDRSGHAIAMLYFTNSLGAGVGVLASGFYFIPAAGLPGTLIASGIINLAVAAAVILLPRRPSAVAGLPFQPERLAPLTAEAARRVRLLLVIAALTGASSFMYEIGWIRMLALVLGSSTHAFELMLSAFILGLAFGGLWVRRRIDAAGDTMRLLGFVQLAMGVAALATLPVYGESFYAMRWLLTSLAPSEPGYGVFNVASHAIALAVMFPAAFCAGMTLPLVTKTLLGLGSGERAIGQVYAANTAGSIVGVLAAVHLGLPLLGVKGLIIAGAAIDLALAVVLLGAAPGRLRRTYTTAAVAASVLVLVGATLVRLDAHNMASGVYRLGILMDPNRYRMLHHEDGKTTTVSVTTEKTVLSLRNNGKSDGSLNSDPAGHPTGDEFTMAMIGALPMLMMPEARQVANIGFGTGLTAQAVLASERLERLDTIEIEPAVVRAARHFMPFNRRAYEDPRSHVHIEDAKTFFSSQQALYDVIISEPSNPWVSGVASLFSSEFYRHARRHLRQGGLFVQWVQLYEFSPALLASVIEALRPVFSDYVVYIANDGDLILVAANGGRVPEPQAEAFAQRDVTALFKRLGIGSVEELKLHRVGGRRILDPYFRSFGAEPNSDFFPVIDLNASKARFMRARATGAVLLTEAPLPLLDIFEPGHMADPSDVVAAGGPERIKRPLFVQQASWVHDYLLQGDPQLLRTMARGPAGELRMLRAALIECRVRLPAGVAAASMSDFARLVNPFLPREQATAVWRKLESSPCISSLDASERRWLRLHAAVGARDPSGMGDAAAAILAADQELDGDSRTFVVAVLMAGRTVAGERSEAVKAFQTYRSRLRSTEGWKPIFTFLSAHALGPMGGDASSGSDNN